MAELLKNRISPAFVADICTHFKAVHPTFDAAAYTRQVFDASWPDLELKQRLRHLALTLRAVLPAEWPEALSVVEACAERLVMEYGENMSFEYGFLNDFVEIYGLDDPDRALPALERITRWASAEFAVRPFLLRYPERMYDQMLQWADHPSALVRRLSTEGFRPRLPWGMGIPALKKDPSPMLPVLEKLKNDPAETVRRSVANHLNDISKDHPALALELARRWQGQHENTDWVVRHALRGLLKKGNPQALAQFGYTHGVPGVVLQLLHCTPALHVGETLYFGLRVHNQGTETAKLRLEYAIDYRTGSGKMARKVFLIRQIELAPAAAVEIEKYQRFTDFTTRKHYPGTHQLELLLNGAPMDARHFEVL
jgi:3-methyladenine DNA glycosylase AlkC